MPYLVYSGFRRGSGRLVSCLCLCVPACLFYNVCCLHFFPFGVYQRYHTPSRIFFIFYDLSSGLEFVFIFSPFCLRAASHHNVPRIGAVGHRVLCHCCYTSHRTHGPEYSPPPIHCSAGQRRAVPHASAIGSADDPRLSSAICIPRVRLRA